MLRTVKFAKEFIVRRLALLVLLALMVVPLLPVDAQAQEPASIIDSVIQDLGQRLNKPLNRSNTYYEWSLNVYPDTSLGCPKPDTAYTQKQTFGFQIILRPIGSDVSYDYRAYDDGRFFPCSLPGLDEGGAPTEAATAPPPPTAEPLAPTAPPVFANTEPTAFQAPVFAFLNADGNVYVTSLGVNPGPVALTTDAGLRFEPRSVYATKDRDYSLLRWSPDGTRLVFIDNRTQTLYLAKSGEAVKELYAGTAIAIPAAWSLDGTEVAYTVPAGRGDPAKNEEIYQLQAIADAGAQPRVAGQIGFGTGCGGGGFSPSTVLYFQETGYEGNGITLIWTDRGFIHTTRCTGIGLRLSDFTGKPVWEVDDVKRVVVSPDRTRAVGIIQADMQGDPTVPGERLVLIDLATGKVSDVATAGGVDQAAWTADGKQIVFSTRTLREAVTGLADNALGAALFPGWPGPFANNDMRLWTVSATGGQPALVAGMQGYAIGAIQSIPGLQAVTFSLITSEAELVKRLNAGGSEADTLALRPKIVTYSAALGVGTIEPQVIISEGGLVAFGTAAQFTAVPGTPVQ